MKNNFLLIVILFTSATVLAEEGIDRSLGFVKSAGVKIKLEKVTSGLGIPWGMAFISPTKLLITERSGEINLLDLKSSIKTRLKNVPKVLVDGQGGMLDVAVPPDYATTKWIYFTYVKNIKGNGATTLSRAKLESDRLNQWQELLVTQSTTSTGYHFGSRITFDETGHVYFGIGDRGERPLAQNLTNHVGTIIRLYLDGTVPADNPFVNNKSVLPEIWWGISPFKSLCQRKMYW